MLGAEAGGEPEKGWGPVPEGPGEVASTGGVADTSGGERLRGRDAAGGATGAGTGRGGLEQRSVGAGAGGARQGLPHGAPHPGYRSAAGSRTAGGRHKPRPSRPRPCAAGPARGRRGRAALGRSCKAVPASDPSPKALGHKGHGNAGLAKEDLGASVQPDLGGSASLWGGRGHPMVWSKTAEIHSLRAPAMTCPLRWIPDRGLLQRPPRSAPPVPRPAGGSCGKKRLLTPRTPSCAPRLAWGSVRRHLRAAAFNLNLAGTGRGRTAPRATGRRS